MSALKITKRTISKLVLEELENTNFPKNLSRNNVSSKSTTCFVMGDVNYRGQQSLGGRTRGPSRWNNKFPELYFLLQTYIEIYEPNFKYTSIQVNKNVMSQPHVDKNNVGPSYGIAIGDFTGGELVIEGQSFNIKNKWKKFNGTLGHWITPFKGTRYSLIYFTHTFKPPSGIWRNVVITNKGIYKYGKLIKSYDKNPKRKSKKVNEKTF